MSVPRTGRRVPAAPAAPAGPSRDLWTWACLLAPMALLARAWGAPLGEPVADDLYFLHRGLFGPVGWLDGFGSPLYWRPVGRQAYFLSFGPVILA